MQFFCISTKDNIRLTKHLVKNLRDVLGASSVHFIVPNAEVDDFRQAVHEFPFVHVHPETGFTSKINLQDVRTWNVSGFPERASWYYQQILKLSIAESSICETQYVIWDADTIPYRNFTLFNGNKISFTASPFEFHKPYFDTNEILIGYNRGMSGPHISAISQHMPVDRTIMLSLLDSIGKKSRKNWIDAICLAISGNRDGRSLFSEYELYFDFVTTNHKDSYEIKQLPWLRIGRSLSDVELIAAKKLFYFIAFEKWHQKQISFGSIIKRWKTIVRTLVKSRLRMLNIHKL